MTGPGMSSIAEMNAHERNSDKPAASVILYRDGSPVQRLELTRSRTTIGRRTYNDIVIDAVGVSAEHAVILSLPDGYAYEDLDSTNGSRINGEAVSRHLLDAGDVIAFGAYTLVFVPIAVTDTPVQPVSHELTPDELRQPPQPVPGAPRADKAVAIVRILDGFAAGREYALTRPMTTIGHPDRQVAVFIASPGGYALVHVEGVPATVNGSAVTSTPRPLDDGDLITIGNTRAIFFLDWWRHARRP